MYEYISGTVAEATPAYAVIDAGGVGYYLHISLETFSAVEHAQNARLYVHYIVREDAQILYGFATKVEREFFRHLISVSGVGGNTARMILSALSPAELVNVISTENANMLKTVKGIGLKTAQRVIVDLKDKIKTGAMAATAVGGAAGVIHVVDCPTTDCQPNDNVEALRVFMLSKRIEVRPVWKPMHKQPVYKDVPAYVNGVSEAVFKVGMCLPAGPYVTDDDVRYIVESIKEAIVK